MRYFHKQKNVHYSRPINVDKLWSLVPKEEKNGVTESSDVVPVIDTLAAGYTKVLGNGLCVLASVFIRDPDSHVILASLSSLAS